MGGYGVVVFLVVVNSGVGKHLTYLCTWISCASSTILQYTIKHVISFNLIKLLCGIKVESGGRNKYNVLSLTYGCDYNVLCVQWKLLGQI